MRLIFTLCCFLLSFIAYTQSLNWAVSSGGSNSETIGSIDVDATGNVYTVGEYRSTVDFDPSGATANLTSVSSSVDVFIQKLDASGNFLWAMSVGGSGQGDNAYDVEVDDTGNCYVSGRFNLTADFDPGSGTQNLTATGNSDGFILKLDPDGNFLWVRQLSSSASTSSSTNVFGITVDNDGDILATGSFRGTTDFDPGSGVASITANSTDMFILKLNSSGNYEWAVGLTGSSFGIGEDIATDADLNVYVAGRFTSSVDFDPGSGNATLASSGSWDACVLKLNGDGDYQWAKKIGGSSEDYGLGLALDLTGDVYLAGIFRGTVDFDPGTGTSFLTATGTSDLYVLKLDNDGNFVWVRPSDGVGNATANAVTVDDSQHVYVTGFKNGAISGFGSFAGDGEIAIEKLAPNGDIIWSTVYSGTGDDEGLAVAVDPTGAMYVAGIFESTVDFDPEATTENLTSNGGTDVFLQKIDLSTILPIGLGNFYTTPQSDGILIQWETVSELNNDFFDIEHSTDARNWVSLGTLSGAGTTTQKQYYQYLDDAPALGINYYRLKQTDFDGTFSHSGLLAVNFSWSGGLTVFPNPATDQIKITREAPFDSNDVQVFETSGKVISKKLNWKVNSATEIEVDTSLLTPGCYFVRIDGMQSRFCKN